MRLRVTVYDTQQSGPNAAEDGSFTVVDSLEVMETILLPGKQARRGRVRKAGSPTCHERRLTTASISAIDVMIASKVGAAPKIIGAVFA